MVRFSRLVDGVAWRRRLSRALALAAVAALAGCAQQPQLSSRHYNGKEYFPEGKYGHASPRVIADGQPVPHGGGQYLVGHPYTIAGHTYYPSENESYSAVGLASWYGDAFQGRRTANGEVYDKESISAAHPTMPLPSYARVTNLENGHSIIVRVNDRGPYHGGRVMDVSSRVADALDFKGAGTARVKVEYVGRASLDGSDDNKLLATLRVDGAPAALDGSPTISPVMVATDTVESVGKAFIPAPIRPQPAPERSAAVAQPSPQETVEPPARPLPASAPVPPARPFDLGTIPNAAIPVSRTSETLPLPPRRMQASVESALYFADGAAGRPLLQGKGPFAQLKTRGSTPLNERP